MIKTPVPSTDSMKVAARVRPFSQDPKNPEHVKTFTFDLAYWSHSGFQKDKDGVLIPTDPASKFIGQEDVFDDIGRGILDSAWQGYNATLLAYGQTGSGKSYSMTGFGANKGIIPRVCEELFQAIKNQEKSHEYQVTFSMLEIYNEQIRDLLSRTKKPGGLKVREDQQLGFFVEGLMAVPCENYAQIERLMEQGVKARTTASTNMNAASSRSHVVITIQLKQVFPDRALARQASISLVDLAGSERQKSSGAEGDRLKEGSRVNLSLTSLGNVISALADAALGRKVLHIPYRDSVLTKLLQSALGGNSRTTLIAAISPADICYEETLSTLRYAERAKKVRNKAVVNTWALARESRPESNKSLLRCGNSGVAEQPAHFLGQHRVGTPRGTWAHRLQQAWGEWEEEYAAIARERQMTRTLPHLINVNEDPQLTGVLNYFILTGSCDAGQAASNAIVLQGLGISDKHASFTNLDGQVTVTPHSGCKVVVNGVPITARTKLQHLDRVILGSNSTYLYVGFPSERGRDDTTRFDYDFFQLERAAAQGVSVDTLGAVSGGEGQADPSVLAVFQDYVKLMPLVAEANQMSEELRKGLKMELKVKNLASSDSRGCDLQKEVMVKVTSQRTHEVWIWSKAKFVNRKFLMEELYRRFLDGEAGCVAQEDDPFWDPVDVVHVGSAHIWLQPLAHCMAFEDQVEFLNCDGLEEALLHVHLGPCSPAGRAHGEEEVVIDPLELLGRRIDFQIRIVRCLGVKWLKEVAKRGIQIGCVPSGFKLHFLFSEGCAEWSCPQLDLLSTGEGHVLLDTKKLPRATDMSQTTADQEVAREVRRLKLQQETELLRNANRALREENELLRDSRGKTGSGRPVQMPTNTPTTARRTATEADSTCPSRASCDRELARALKAFYRSMNVARGQLLRLRQRQPPDDDQVLRPFVHQQAQMLKDFGDLFESSLWKLKNDVALIVKKRREYRISNREVTPTEDRMSEL